METPTAGRYPHTPMGDLWPFESAVNPWVAPAAHRAIASARSGLERGPEAWQETDVTWDQTTDSELETQVETSSGYVFF